MLVKVQLNSLPQPEVQGQSRFSVFKSIVCLFFIPMTTTPAVSFHFPIPKLASTLGASQNLELAALFPIRRCRELGPAGKRALLGESSWQGCPPPTSTWSILAWIPHQPLLQAKPAHRSPPKPSPSPLKASAVGASPVPGTLRAEPQHRQPHRQAGAERGGGPRIRKATAQEQDEA